MLVRKRFTISRLPRRMQCRPTITGFTVYLGIAGERNSTISMSPFSAAACNGLRPSPDAISTSTLRSNNSETLTSSPLGISSDHRRMSCSHRPSDPKGTSTRRYRRSQLQLVTLSDRRWIRCRRNDVPERRRYFDLAPKHRYRPSGPYTPIRSPSETVNLSSFLIDRTNSTDAVLPFTTVCPATSPRTDGASASQDRV